MRKRSTTCQCVQGGAQVGMHCAMVDYNGIKNSVGGKDMQLLRLDML